MNPGGIAGHGGNGDVAMITWKDERGAGLGLTGVSSTPRRASEDPIDDALDANELNLGEVNNEGWDLKSVQKALHLYRSSNRRLGERRRSTADHRRVQCGVGIHRRRLCGGVVSRCKAMISFRRDGEFSTALRCLQPWFAYCERSHSAVKDRTTSLH